MASNASLSFALSFLLGKSPSWFIYYACCNYMTPHISLFSKLELAHQPLTIHTAKGSTMHGRSIGFVLTSNLLVSRVLHVPKLL